MSNVTEKPSESQYSDEDTTADAIAWAVGIFSLVGMVSLWLAGM